MATYTFDFTVANATLDGMRAVNEKIKSALESLDQYARQHLTEWTGEAQAHYGQAKATWDDAAGEMTRQLHEGEKALLTISDGYGLAEQRASQLWANTRTGF